MSDHLFHIALAYVSDLADEADCQDSIDEIRNLLIDNPNGEAEVKFNKEVNIICNDLETQIQDYNKPQKPLTNSQENPEHLMRMINLWNIYIEENKCAILEAEIDEDDVAIMEYQQENKIHRKNIANYEEKLKALKEI